MKKYHFSENALRTAWQVINDADTIALLPHYKPDGDALSACAALERVLRQHNKQVETIYPGGMPDQLPHQPEPLLNNTHTVVPDLLISCDTANAERLYLPDAFADVPLMVIDHHVSNSLGERATHTFLAPEASSTCEVLHFLLQEWSIEVDTPLADILLYGILSDTQCFRTSNTSGQTLAVAGDLVHRGANLYEMAGAMTQRDNPAIISLWGELLSTAEYNHRAIWTTCTQEQLKKHTLDESALAGVVNQLASMSTLDIAILFYEEENGRSKASLRSKQTNVNALAQHFGGGGHVRAAGLSSEEPLKIVVEKVLATLS